MKKIFVIAALLSVVVATPASASDGKAYAGIRVGQSNLTDNPLGFGILGGYTIAEPNTLKGNNFLSKLKIAVEGEYINLGSSSYATGSVKASSIGVSLVAKYPFNDQFSALASAGLARTTVETKINAFGPFPGFSSSSTSLGVHGGIAGEYNLTREFTLRGGYDFYPNSRDLISVAGIFNF